MSANETKPSGLEQQIEEVVFAAFESELAMPRSHVKKTDRLIQDLKLDSDDLSFLFIPTLEKQLHVSISTEEWGAVYSVQDAIDLLLRHKRQPA